jgi:hypothetical protein
MKYFSLLIEEANEGTGRLPPTDLETLIVKSFTIILLGLLQA